MSLFRIFDIAASGMTAERLRMDVIANNLANANTTRTPRGGAYRRQMPVFAVREEGRPGLAALAAWWRGEGAGFPGRGVRVVSVADDPRPLRLVYDPHHPEAGPDGYVEFPNVNVVTEMVDLISASRAYEANVTVVETARAMALKALEIGRA